MNIKIETVRGREILVKPYSLQFNLNQKFYCFWTNLYRKRPICYRTQSSSMNNKDVKKINIMMKMLKKAVKWYINQYAKAIEPIVKYNVPIYM